MPVPSLARQQMEIVCLPPGGSIFLEGPAGCGKTTVAVERMLALLGEGLPPDRLLILAPQRTLLAPYADALHSPALGPGGMVDLFTINGMAQRLIDLFWPLIADGAGFAHPDCPPTFLTVETAQYYMAHLVRPLLEKGYFESVSIDRNRLYSQVLDNLNKAAVARFPYGEIGERLAESWKGESAQRRVYQDAQECADRFRAYCLEHNLLDFSLQMELLGGPLWDLPACRDYLRRRYSALIYENVEEDTPLAHDWVADWLPELESSLVIMDWEAGYRRFLGADPEHAAVLRMPTTIGVSLCESFVSPPPLQALSYELARSLGRRADAYPSLHLRENHGIRDALFFRSSHFHPGMIAMVADEVARLVNEEQVPPREIAILPPYLGDAERFALVNSLARREIPVRTHRPSRGLREETAVRCLITLAKLAHPHWQLAPRGEEVTLALMQAIHGLDLVRGHLLSRGIYHRHTETAWEVSGFDGIDRIIRERITYSAGERFQRLNHWLVAWGEEPEVELDVFFSRLFGEILSQPGFGFFRSPDAGAAAATLIESIRKFRWEVGPALAEEGKPLAQEYIQMVEEGVISAQYVRRWRPEPMDAVYIAPAHTFLMNNRPVEIQFWLDAGSRGWWERLNQPLTQPYVLSSAWQRGALWTDVEEYEVNQEALFRLCLGLLRRCRRAVYLAFSELGQQGFQQRGPLLDAMQEVLRGCPAEVEGV
ncbi:MAG TPA: hypothetical protein VGJ97_00925 [Anaerolineaceae bacterium]